MGVVTLRMFLVAVAACALVACGDQLPRHEEFAVGMERSTIRERFGEPIDTQEMRKTHDAIFGPIEDFWSGLAMGATVEIWSYPTIHEFAAGTGRRQAGTTELYFVDGSNEVSGRGFAPEGVVY